jgi:phosphoribosylanthranilate isomerase
MRLIVKTCGLQNADDVEIAVDAGADAIGCVFYAKSSRYIEPTKAARIAANVPSNVLRVAVMHHPKNTEWQEVLQEFTPDVLQTDIEDFDALSIPPSVKAWPVIRENTLASRSGVPGVFLYEGKRSGTGETIDWQRAKEVAERGSMILAGGLHAGNVAAAIETVRPDGVDASSGLETAPGQKSPALIRQFVEAARAAERCFYEFDPETR